MGAGGGFPCVPAEEFSSRRLRHLPQPDYSEVKSEPSVTTRGLLKPSGPVGGEYGYNVKEHLMKLDIKPYHGMNNTGRTAGALTAAIYQLAEH